MAGVQPGIITGGLGGDHSNMICGFFHLGPLTIIFPGSPPGGSPIVPPIPPTLEIPNRGGGGAGGRHPVWHDRTERWDIDQPRTIIIQIKYKGETTERMFVVSAKREKFIIKVTNFISKTRDMISIKVSNVKNKFAKVVAKFKGDKD